MGTEFARATARFKPILTVPSAFSFDEMILKIVQSGNKFRLREIDHWTSHIDCDIYWRTGPFVLHFTRLVEMPWSHLHMVPRGARRAPTADYRNEGAFFESALSC